MQVCLFPFWIQLGPNVSIGTGVTIGAGVRVRESVILHGATLQVSLGESVPKQAQHQQRLVEGLWCLFIYRRANEVWRE